MIRTWRNIGGTGVVGLLHPDTHFVGDREKFLRAEAYRPAARPRRFRELQATGSSRRPVNRSTHFGMHIYGRPKEIGFAHLSWLTGCGGIAKVAGAG